MFSINQRKKKKGQVWIETVIYTLIGLAIIGILLASAKPKIDEIKDKLVIEQTIESLNNLDEKIYEVQRSPGNRRIVDFKITKGVLGIDAQEDSIVWLFESNYQYSEEGEPINLGSLELTTTKGNPWLINLTLDYAIDLQYEGNVDELKEFQKAPSPYQLYIENMGTQTGNIVVDIGER
jgi:hypothetical protein